MRGVFVTLEGIEGAGKSTQLALLARRFDSAPREVVTTREPGGNDRLAAALRALLKDPEIWRELELAEVYLYAAARAHHLESLVLPALARDAVVLCDRYLDSTRAYQGHGRGRPLELIEALHAHAPFSRSPDRTYLIDLPVEDALARSREREIDEAEGYDGATVSFFERVRAGFLEIAERDAQRVVVVDGSLSPSEVHERIASDLAGLVPELGE